MLAKITSAVRARVESRMRQTPLSALQEIAAQSPAPRNFAAAITPRNSADIRIIAEIKRPAPEIG